MSVDGAAVDVLGVAPDVGQQPGPRLHASLALHQQAQQAKLGGGQRHIAAAHGGAVRRRVEADLAELDDRGGLLFAGVPAQDRLDPQDDLARAERLGDVVVGAELEADDAVELLALRGQHDERQAGGRGVALEQARELEAVEARQHQIEDDEVGETAANRLESAVAPAFDRHSEAGALEVELQHFGDVRLVFDDQNARRDHAGDVSMRPSAGSAEKPAENGCGAGRRPRCFRPPQRFEQESVQQA